MAASDLAVDKRLHLASKVEDHKGQQGIKQQPGHLSRENTVTVDLQHMLAFTLYPLYNQQAYTPHQHGRHLHGQSRESEQRRREQAYREITESCKIRRRILNNGKI